MVDSSHTCCHERYIQQHFQVDMDDEHDIALDQSNEVDSFLPTSVSALETNNFVIFSYYSSAGTSQTC